MTTKSFAAREGLLDLKMRPKHSKQVMSIIKKKANKEVSSFASLKCGFGRDNEQIGGLARNVLWWST